MPSPSCSSTATPRRSTCAVKECSTALNSISGQLTDFDMLTDKMTDFLQRVIEDGNVLQSMLTEESDDDDDMDDIEETEGQELEDLVAFTENDKMELWQNAKELFREKLTSRNLHKALEETKDVLTNFDAVLEMNDEQAEALFKEKFDLLPKPDDDDVISNVVGYGAIRRALNINEGPQVLQDVQLLPGPSSMVEHAADVVVDQEGPQKYIDQYTRKEIRDGVVNKICGHVYERSTIMELLERNKGKKKTHKLKCFYLGCSNKTPITKDHLKDML